jgi:hypothetical protein
MADGKAAAKAFGARCKPAQRRENMAKIDATS